MNPDVDAVDTFGGPGGWSEGLKRLGKTEIGLEWDASACATRRAAGHLTVRCDVAQYPTNPFRGVRGFIASPPCQAFSSAGSRRAVDYIPDLMCAVACQDWSARPDPDPKVWLVLEVGRWIDALRPEWIACEQVPEVLPIWLEYAEWLRSIGYDVWAGKLNAANFGVPQTRTRAILMASRVRSVEPPTPTHAQHPTPGLFGDTLNWISAAEACPDLKHRVIDRRTNSKDGRGGSAPTVTVATTEPSPTVTSKAGGQWIMKPARTLCGHRQPRWIYDRPATTVMGDPRLGRPGHKDRAGGESQFAEDSIKLTVRDALILQSFRPDYPVVGSKSKAFEQIGNAFPPLLAAHVLGQLTTNDRELTHV